MAATWSAALPPEMWAGATANWASSPNALRTKAAAPAPARAFEDIMVSSFTNDRPTIGCGAVPVPEAQVPGRREVHDNQGWGLTPQRQPPGRYEAISAGEGGRDLGELPVVLRDAGAVGHHAAAGARPVPVDRPERQAGQVVVLRVVADLLPLRGRGVLLLVRQAVHAGDTHVPVRRGVVPPEGGLEHRLEALGSAHRAGVHVGAATEVERHDGEHVDAGAGRHRAADELLRVVAGAGGGGAEGDDDLQARVVLLDDLQRVDDPVTDGVVLELV